MQRSLPRQLGPYLISGEIGQGGMGAVYRGRHERLGVERAIKVILRHDPRLIARFQREAAHLARIDHPNVVRIHEAGVEQGRPFFAMDLLEGRGLDSHLEQGAVPLQRALEWAIGICRGVDALHAEGIVHRDLKPQNVFVTGERPVVLDVGLAINVEQDERLTKTGALVGTINYMAPEQFGKGEVTPRADVYALGLILYELLTGVPAVSGGPGAEVAADILGNDRPVPSEQDPDLPASLDAVCARATRRDPDQRYGRAGELADALETIRADPGRSRRSARRLRSAAAVAGLGLLGGGLAFALATRPEPATHDEPAPSPAADRAAARLARLRTIDSAELRYRKVSQWLEEYPQHPAHAEAARVHAEARRRFGAARVRPLRSIDKPHLLYEGVREWLDTFGEDHPKANAVRELLRAVAAKGPIRVLESGVWVRFLPRSPDMAVVAGRGGVVHLWNVERGRQLRVLWEGGLRMLAVPPSGGAVLIAKRRELMWVDLRGRSRSFCEVPFPVREFAFSARGDAVAIAGRRRIQVHSVPAGELLGTVRYPVDIYAVGLSDDRRVVVGGAGWLGHPTLPTPDVRVLALEDGRQLAKHKLVGTCRSIAFARDGRTFAVGTNLGRVMIYRVDQLEGRALSGRALRVTGAAIVAAQAVNGVAEEVAFSHDGSRLYAVSRDRVKKTGELRGWELPSGKELPHFERPGAPLTLDVSPDGRWVLVGFVRSPCELWLRGGR